MMKLRRSLKRKTANELNNDELIYAFASVCKRIEENYKEKKELEEEMKSRFNKKLDMLKK